MSAVADIEVAECPAKLRAIFLEAAQFYLHMQVPAESLGLLRIEIALEDMEHTAGCCQSLEDNDEELLTEFRISLSTNITKDEQLRALAHECVHVCQYFTGRMRDTGGMFDAYWLGKRVDMRVKDYATLPWEREALHLEWTLLNAFRLRNVPQSR